VSKEQFILFRKGSVEIGMNLDDVAAIRQRSDWIVPGWLGAASLAITYFGLRIIEGPLAAPLTALGGLIAATWCFARRPALTIDTRQGERINLLGSEKILTRLWMISSRLRSGEDLSIARQAVQELLYTSPPSARNKQKPMITDQVIEAGQIDTDDFRENEPEIDHDPLSDGTKIVESLLTPLIWDDAKPIEKEEIQVAEPPPIAPSLEGTQSRALKAMREIRSSHDAQGSFTDSINASPWSDPHAPAMPLDLHSTHENSDYHPTSGIEVGMEEAETAPSWFEKGESIFPAFDSDLFSDPYGGGGSETKTMESLFTSERGLVAGARIDVLPNEHEYSPKIVSERNYGHQEQETDKGNSFVQLRRTHPTVANIILSRLERKKKRMIRMRKCKRNNANNASFELIKRRSTTLIEASDTEGYRATYGDEGGHPLDVVPDAKMSSSIRRRLRASHQHILSDGKSFGGLIEEGSNDESALLKSTEDGPMNFSSLESTMSKEQKGVLGLRRIG